MYLYFMAFNLYVCYCLIIINTLGYWYKHMKVWVFFSTQKYMMRSSIKPKLLSQSRQSLPYPLLAIFIFFIVGNVSLQPMSMQVNYTKGQAPTLQFISKQNVTYKTYCQPRESLKVTVTNFVHWYSFRIKQNNSHSLTNNRHPSTFVIGQRYLSCLDTKTRQQR